MQKVLQKGDEGSFAKIPCLESELFEKWAFNGGMWHHGPRKGEQIPIHNTAPGQIVIFTTRRPDQTERERQIIGAYEIAKIDEEYNLFATRDNRIRLTKQQSEMLPFWRYHKNYEPGATWNTGLFRCLYQDEVHTILNDMSTVCGSTLAGDAARALLEKHFRGSPILPPHGAINDSVSVSKRVARARKYPGREGKDHIALKNWIAHNPTSIGLPNKSLPDVELCVPKT